MKKTYLFLPLYGVACLASSSPKDPNVNQACVKTAEEARQCYEKIIALLDKEIAILKAHTKAQSIQIAQKDAEIKAELEAYRQRIRTKIQVCNARRAKRSTSASILCLVVTLLATIHNCIYLYVQCQEAFEHQEVPESKARQRRSMQPLFCCLPLYL